MPLEQAYKLARTIHVARTAETVSRGIAHNPAPFVIEDGSGGYTKFIAVEPFKDITYTITFCGQTLSHEMRLRVLLSKCIRHRHYLYGVDNNLEERPAKGIIFLLGEVDASTESRLEKTLTVQIKYLTLTAPEEVETLRAMQKLEVNLTAGQAPLN